MPDLSFSSDALRTAAQYVDEAATCTTVTPPTGDPCSRFYAQRISGPIDDLNQEEAEAIHSNMMATLQSVEEMENTLVSSFSTVIEG